MNDMTPDKIKDLLESAIKSNTSAWVAQSKYFDDLVKRNVASFAALTDSRLESLKKISESKTFNEAFEANVAYEETVRSALQNLYEENKKSWEVLQSELKTIYAPASGDKAAGTAAPKKKEKAA
jgi:cell shape-determining protein MreC